MSKYRVSLQIEEEIRRMVRCSSRALIFLSVAWACLTIGVFTVYPTGPVGIFFLCVGIPCMFISIGYFICHWLHSQRAKRLILQQEAPTDEHQARQPHPV
jgi:hypothetical protein